MENQFSISIPHFSYYQRYLEYLIWKYPNLDFLVTSLARGVETKKKFEGEDIRSTEFLKGYKQLEEPVKVLPDILKDRIVEAVQYVVESDIKPFFDKAKVDVHHKNVLVIEFMQTLYEKWGFDLQYHFDGFKGLMQDIPARR